MSTPAVKRACDACHRRKVKCDGINPCRNCASAQLACTYNAIPQKKGPKGSRAKVISELRETQKQASLSAKSQARNGPAGPPFGITPGLLSNELLKDSVEFFFTHMYSTLPILSRSRIESEARYKDGVPEIYCLFTSLCAFVLLQPGSNGPPMANPDPFSMDAMMGNMAPARKLLEETIRVRRNCDQTETLNAICTSYFIFACYQQLGQAKKAWFYLREATTLAHMVEMNREEAYSRWDVTESTMRRRLYWLLLMTERAVAFKQQRPLTLQPTINLPTASNDPSDLFCHQLTSYFALLNVFSPFDETLVGFWNKSRDALSRPYLEQLDQRFKLELLPSFASRDAQFRDLTRNQEWLKQVAWRFDMDEQPELNQNLLLSMVSSFPGQGMEILNMGVVRKLFSITSNAVHYLSMMSEPRNPTTATPRQHLGPILDLVAVIRAGEYSVVPLLLSKVQDALASIADPRLIEGPEVSANFDMFDYGGNTGMGPAYFSGFEFEDNKFNIPRIEDCKPEPPSSSGSAPSATDVNSPFTSSPPMLSPGVEFPHGLQTEFSSMSDVGMSPLSQVPSSSINTPGGMNHPQAQFQQHHSMATLQGMGLNIGQASNMSMNDQAQNMNSVFGQSLNSMNVIAQGMNANGMMMRPQPQRSSSFALPQRTIQTVADFQNLQSLPRANSDMSTLGQLGMPGLPTEIDFNTPISR